MDVYEESRKAFLKKLGISFSSILLASSRLSASINDENETLVLTNEQYNFISNYEKWMDEFIEVIKIQKIDSENLANNKELVRLSEIAKTWQPQLVEYMKDDNFARYYMIVTERMTKEI
jgi:hypothetical protein